MASVRDCRALAEAHPVEVTRARIPCVISSHAAQREREREISHTDLLTVHTHRRSETLGTDLLHFFIHECINELAWKKLVTTALRLFCSRNKTVISEDVLKSIQFNSVFLEQRF